MINFTAESLDLPKLDYRLLKKWIETVLFEYNRIDGDIHFYFCDDEYLLRINIEYLNHDYYTDIITFDFCVDNIVSGDLILSLDTIKTNSVKYETEFYNELFRVIIHGILHLVGFSDKTEIEQLEMTKKEDECLQLLKTLD